MVSLEENGFVCENLRPVFYSKKVQNWEAIGSLHTSTDMLASTVLQKNIFLLSMV